jgi:hypothetical protein
MLIPNMVTDDLNSLDIPCGLIDLLIENSMTRERLLKMTVDDLAFILSIDIEAAKIINKFSNKLLQLDPGYERA